MCLHGVPETSERRQVLNLEMHLFLDTPFNIKKTHSPPNFNLLVFAANLFQGSGLPME